jgi:hypothetical protein
MDKTFKEIEFSVSGLNYVLHCTALDCEGEFKLLYFLSCNSDTSETLFSINSDHIYYCEDLQRLEFSRGAFDSVSGQISKVSNQLGKKLMDWSHEHSEYILFAESD